MELPLDAELFEPVIAKEIALGLNDICAAPALPHRVVPAQPRRERGHRVAAMHRLRYDLPQARDALRQRLGEPGREDQLTMGNIPLECF